jgi:hypothetical protein
VSSPDTDPAAVGVAENGNEALLVTVDANANVLDRRQILVSAPGLSSHPHHHEGGWALGRYLGSPWARPTRLEDAIALVEQVTAAAADAARAALDALAVAVPTPIAALAIRAYPELPPTIEARIRDPRAHTVADSAMYRQALADAAAARGWRVHRYERETVDAEAAAAIGGRALADVLRAMGTAVGPPWQARHKLAATAALAALAAPTGHRRSG